MVPPLLRPSQVRAARALLEWTQQHLADESGVGITTVKHFEAGIRIPMQKNVLAIRLTLEIAGVEFFTPDGRGPGVYLKDPNADVLKSEARRIAVSEMIEA